MRYLGIDYGERRMGLALSDEKGGFAFPKETIPNDVSAIDRIAKIVKEEGVQVFVMGDTRAANGAENPITPAAEAFAESLTRHTRLPLERVREAWSSVEAGRFAPKGKEHDDAAAAAVILQRFLDTQQKPDAEEEL